MEAFCLLLQFSPCTACTSPTVGLPVNLGIMNVMVFTSILEQFPRVVLLLACLLQCFLLSTLQSVLDLLQHCFPLQAPLELVSCALPLYLFLFSGSQVNCSMLPFCCICSFYHGFYFIDVFLLSFAKFAWFFRTHSNL